MLWNFALIYLPTSTAIPPSYTVLLSAEFYSFNRNSFLIPAPRVRSIIIINNETIISGFRVRILRSYAARSDRNRCAMRTYSFPELRWCTYLFMKHFIDSTFDRPIMNTSKCFFFLRETYSRRFKTFNFSNIIISYKYLSYSIYT